MTFFDFFQIEANSEFVNKKRASVSFLPNEPAAASFLEVWLLVSLDPLRIYEVACLTNL